MQKIQLKSVKNAKKSRICQYCVFLGIFTAFYRWKNMLYNMFLFKKYLFS
jgi:hypothetical protein